MYRHKTTVESIKNLSWQKLSITDLEFLMILCAYAAREFAESLRIALELYPLSPEFREMASGELNTDNLRFGDYQRAGDHADFLWHFIDKHELLAHHPKAREAGEKYLARIRALSKEVRAMSIISRERELSDIFECILQNINWLTPPLLALEHFLREHIRLDKMEGGHADLLSEFEVTDDVLEFYEIRLDMYRSLSTLFLQFHLSPTPHF